jgi:tetratricopeptide (TPR) repeat protein
MLSCGPSAAFTGHGICAYRNPSDEAIALTEQAAALDPLRANAYLGALLFDAGRYDEAKAPIQTALAINPQLEGAHANLSLVLLAEGHPQQALAEIAQEPSDRNKLTGEALSYHALGRRQRSDSAISKLVGTTITKTRNTRSLRYMPTADNRTGHSNGWSGPTRNAIRD